MHSDDAPKPPRKPTFHWHKPRSVLVGALTHEGAERAPNDPMIPCLKMRGMWMKRAGIDVGARLKVDIYKGIIVLSVEGGTVQDEEVRIDSRKSVTYGGKGS